jgi:hypothetical protein
VTDPIDKATATVTTEIARTDAKATALLSAGGILATALGLITTSDHASIPATVIAATLLAASLIQAALIIRPRLDGTHRGSFLHWATIDPADPDHATTIDNDLAHDGQHARLINLSVLCAAKMRSLRRATHTTIAAILALAVAAAASTIR